MFNLIRRISYGVIPRPDRPWEEDATSNAPAPRRKRRLSSTVHDSRDASDELARSKKARQSPVRDTQEGRETPVPRPEAETEEVTEVTQGVKEVVLDKESTENPAADREEGQSTSVEGSTITPESVPLPEGGLDDFEDAPSPPVGSEEDENSTPEHAPKEGEAVSEESKDDEGISSSDNEDEVEKETGDVEASTPVDATTESQKAQLSLAEE